MLLLCIAIRQVSCMTLFCGTSWNTRTPSVCSTGIILTIRSFPFTRGHRYRLFVTRVASARCYRAALSDHVLKPFTAQTGVWHTLPECFFHSLHCKPNHLWPSVCSTLGENRVRWKLSHVGENEFGSNWLYTKKRVSELFLESDYRRGGVAVWAPVQRAEHWSTVFHWEMRNV